MSYITRFYNELTIDPPLSFAEVETSRFREDRAKENRLDVKIRVEEESVITSGGVLTRRTGVALLPT